MKKIEWWRSAAVRFRSCRAPPKVPNFMPFHTFPLCFRSQICGGPKFLLFAECLKKGRQ